MRSKRVVREKNKQACQTGHQGQQEVEESDLQPDLQPDLLDLADSRATEAPLAEE